MSNFNHDDFNDMLDNEDEPITADFRPATVKVWRTMDGQWLRMSDMAESHLNNAKNYMLRRVDEIEARIKSKCAELVEEPFMVGTYIADVTRLSSELDAVVASLRSLKEETERREAFKGKASDLREEIEGYRGLNQ